MKSTIFTDISFVNDANVHEWLDSFFWPISDDVFINMNKLMMELFVQMIDSIDDQSLDILLCDGFIFFIGQYAHAEAVKSYAAKHNSDLRIGPLSSAYYAPSWEMLSNWHFHELQCGSKLLGMRRHLKNIKYNSTLSIFKQVTGSLRSDALGLGTFTWLKDEYVQDKEIYVDNTYPLLLLEGFVDKQEILPVELTSFLSEYLSQLQKEFQRYYGVYIDMKSVKACWARRLVSLLSIYKYVQKIKLPDLVLATGSAKSITKVISNACKNDGKRAVGFFHGHFMGEVATQFDQINEKSSYSEFICPTSASALGYMDNYLSCGISDRRSVEFESVQSSHFKDLRERYRENVFAERVKTVMVMGFPMNAIRYLEYPGTFFAFQLDLELRLIRTLQENGFDVWYKIHPERFNESYSIMKSMGVEVVGAPFEDVWSQADALVIKYSASTTFVDALCTNLPIYLIDIEKEYWKPSYYSLLSERCVCVPSWYDDFNRVQFDENFLVDKLKDKQELPNYGYVEKYMYPNV